MAERYTAEHTPSIDESDFLHDQLSACADDLAEKLHTDSQRTRAILDHLLALDCGTIWPAFDPDALDNDATLCFTVSPYDALEAGMPRDDILRSFADDVIEHTVTMADFTATIANPIFTPLFSVEEFASHIGKARAFLHANHSSLIQTGLPAERFPGPRWLGDHLTNLYCTKLPRTITESPSGLRAYRWGHASEDDPSHGEVSYEGAPLLPGMTQEDADAVAALREPVLSLRLEILQALADSLSRDSAATLWDRCLQLFTSTLQGPTIDLLTRVDRSHKRCFYDINNSNGTPRMGLIGGRVSDLFRLVGHVEEELSIGLFQKLRDLFKAVLHPDVSGTLRFPTGNYFKWLQRNDMYLLQASKQIHDDLSRRYQTYWEAYRQRVAQAISESFAEMLIVQIGKTSIPLGSYARQDRDFVFSAVKFAADTALGCSDAPAKKAVFLAERIALCDIGEVLLVRVGASQFEFHQEDQKKIIRYMHGCHQRGILDIPQKQIMNYLDSGHDGHPQLRDKFRTHQAWERLIIKGTKTGHYRLALPQ